MTKPIVPFFYFFLVGILISGCINTTNRDITITSYETTSIPVISPTFEFPVSEPNFTTIIGELVVLNPTVALPSENDAIFLVPLIGLENVSSIPQFEVGEVPQAVVDESTGLFVFTNISPGTYIIMVETISAAQIPARKYDIEGLAIVNITDEDKNKTIDLGFLQFP
jgi:hypothetical protein